MEGWPIWAAQGASGLSDKGPSLKDPAGQGWGSPHLHLHPLFCCRWAGEEGLEASLLAGAPPVLSKPGMHPGKGGAGWGGAGLEGRAGPCPGLSCLLDVPSAQRQLCLAYFQAITQMTLCVPPVPWAISPMSRPPQLGASPGAGMPSQNGHWPLEWPAWLAQGKNRRGGKATAFRPAGQELRAVTPAGDKMAPDTRRAHGKQSVAKPRPSPSLQRCLSAPQFHPNGLAPSPTPVRCRDKGVEFAPKGAVCPLPPGQSPWLWQDGLPGRLPGGPAWVIPHPAL